MNQFLSPRRIPLKVTLLVTVDLPGEFFVSFFFLILLGTQNGKHVNYLKTIRDILNNLLCVICDHDSQNHVLYHLPYNVYAYVRGLDCCGHFKATYNVYLLQPKNSVQRYWKTLKLLKKNLLSKSLSAVYDHNCNTFKSFRQI